jgi:GYF domain 2
MYKIIGGDHKQYGPISAEDVRKWIAEDRLNAQTLAQAEGDIEWKQLSVFPEFAGAFASESAMPNVPPVATPADLLGRDYQLDIGGCIKGGWELVKKNFWPIIGVTALIVLITVGINQVFGLFTRPVVNAMITEHRFSPGGILIIFMTIIVSWPIYTVFMAGLFKYYLKLIRGENAGIGDAFSGFGPSIGQLILLSFVMNILMLIGYILLLIPGIYLAVAWFFSIPLVIDKQMGFWQAMELSRKMVSKHWFLMFGFLLVYGLLVMAGIIACCIGIFVTLPIGFAALMYAYETIFSSSQTH